MGPKRRRRILTGVFLLVVLPLQEHQPLHAQLQGEASMTAARQNYAGDEACRACHSEKAASYKTTAHHLTSQFPTKESILGSFCGKQARAMVRNHWIRVYADSSNASSISHPQ